MPHSATDRSRLGSGALVVIGVLATSMVVIAAVFGTVSVPMALVIASVGLAVGVTLLMRRPELLAVGVPLLLGLPLALYFPPAEILMLLVVGVVIVTGMKTSASWLHRLETIEVVNLFLVLWAATTFFWVHDTV